MICPMCGKGEFPEPGVCPECGYAAGSGPGPQEPERNSASGSTHKGAIPVDYSGPSEGGGAELPPWRQELSRRLQEIKRKREGTEHLASEADSQLLPFPRQDVSPSAEATLQTERLARRRQTRPALPPLALPPALPAAKTVPHELAVHAESDLRDGLRLVQPPAPSRDPQPLPLERPLSQQGQEDHSETAAIRDLIDNVTGRKPMASDPTPRILVPPPVLEAPGEGKLILLSRTLGGLVDILIIVLCTGAFILAADFMSGIDVLDQTSLLHYGLLLLAIYVLYSMFFLGTANQTIGMMITDLRVVESQRNRPRPGRLCLRCLLYPPALLALSIGLIWAVFDPDTLCLHDRLSGTSVARV